MVRIKEGGCDLSGNVVPSEMDGGCGGKGSGEQGRRNDQKRSRNKKRNRKTEKEEKNVVRRETRFSVIAYSYIVARQGW